MIKKIFLGIILLLAVFLRFYRLPERATFLGDQGRDLLEARESLLAGQLPLVGPLSNEGVHAGPSYYYLIMPSLLMSHFHPLGPILFTTFLGVMSTYLIYWLGTKFFGQKPALIAALLYATSPLVIQQTSGLWNPIPVPFFSLLIIGAIYQIQVEKKYCWFIYLGLFLSLAVQLYMPAYFLLFPVLGWWTFKIRGKHFPWSLIGFLTFVLALLPFLVFQFQNQFVDFKNLILFLMEKLTLTPNRSVTNPLVLLAQQFRAILTVGPNWLILSLGAIISFLPLIKGKNHWHWFFLSWFLTGILVLTFFPGSSSPHYANFIWILPFLLLASFFSLIKKTKLLFIGGFLLALINLKTYHNNFAVTNDLSRAETVSQFISQKAGQQPFSILLLSARSPSDAHFRYFLKLNQAPVEPLKNENACQLFLICTQPVCPNEQTVQKMSVVETECLPRCPPLQEQKAVDLKQWQLVTAATLAEARIFLFKK
ncbi:hypothetical protein COU97_00100 [Candidatus Shapirobacteria bacterium CG10_big_fil_rev_8_21_14_0_10_48_15]|uniref:Glycosyltransferase RgtA/B/C/D-like domain-containing protein n=1 Tax=Candidatus Shapirobacteria bacterium CG10_big_fil_rev_8_21_14_0_10_48_15 TaxID=1974484 RepID=A0A2M8L7Y4_9BACT|nr:MAG: hypothetical protein COU97_00100 [Candidatus Shapirobacteria bacterium CG10_big_fil_rev_8_21_14_0_10_48_15]